MTEEMSGIYEHREKLRKEAEMKLYVVGVDEKCGGCNEEASIVYMIGRTEEDAMRAYAVHKRGLCGECIAEMLMQEEYEIN